MTSGQRPDGPLMTEAEAAEHARTLEPVDLGVPWRGLTGLSLQAGVRAKKMDCARGCEEPAGAARTP